MRQVDDFAVAATTERTANILFDFVDDELTFPLKRMGLIHMFNGMDISQTRDYIKISCPTYIERVCAKHLATWMRVSEMPDRPTPLPTKRDFLKHFLSVKGDPDPKQQLQLATKMEFKYRSAIGEIIYAMSTCRPDLSYAAIRASQHSICPHEHHYNGVKHMMKYMYLTRDDGLYFWRETPNTHLPTQPLPPINSNLHDLLLDGRPEFEPLVAHGHVDSDWAACELTRRSMTGGGVRLAGGTVGFKTKLQPTMADSSTAAEFMGASDFGKILLFIRSVMWDLGVPQCAATVLYEDNDACTSMAMA